MNHASLQKPLADANGAHPVKPRLVSIQECGVYIGLSTHTIYTMVSQRRIPYVKVGRLVKFDLGLLDRWIQQRTVMPMPPRRL